VEGGGWWVGQVFLCVHVQGPHWRFMLGSGSAGGCWVGPSGLCGGTLLPLVGRRGGTNAVRDMDAEESPEVGESAGDGLDESAGPRPAVQRAAEEDDLREAWRACHG
jgi:hypothetical protein